MNLFRQNPANLYGTRVPGLYASSMTEAPPVRELDITLERNSPVPLYYQLAQSIEHPSTWCSRPGDRLENELSSPAGWVLPADCSQAIKSWSGRVCWYAAGVGTRSCGLNPANRGAQQPQRGHRQGWQGSQHAALEFAIGTLEQDIQDAIDAPTVSDTEFIKIRRLRLADDAPLAILTNYLPARFEITEADLQSKGLYACLRALGVNLKIAHQRISARLMTDEEADLLDEETPAACLTVDRLAYDDVGQFVEFGRHIYHAAQYSIQSSVVA